MTSFKNKNLFYKTLFASTAISLCFSMEVNAGRKEQQEALRLLAEKAARDSAAASRALQQRVNTVMVPQRAEEVRQQVLQAAPVVEVRAQTLARELGSGSAVTRDHVEEVRELVSLSHAPAVQQVHEAVQQRMIQDVGAQSGSFETVSDVHRAFQGHALATTAEIAAVLVRPEVVERRAEFLEEIAAAQVRVKGHLDEDSVQEFVSLRALAPGQTAGVTEALTESMLERGDVTVRDVFGGSATVSGAEEELERHWNERPVVERRVEALTQRVAEELREGRQVSEKRGHEVQALGEVATDEQMTQVAVHMARSMKERGDVADVREVLAHAALPENVLQFFEERVEEAQRGNVGVQQERLARLIGERDYRLAFDVYRALPDSAEKDALRDQLAVKLFQDDIDIDDEMANRAFAAQGNDDDGLIQKARDELAAAYAARGDDARDEVDTLQDDINAADGAGLEGLYERIFNVYGSLSAALIDEVQAALLGRLQELSVRPQEATFEAITARFAATPDADRVDAIMGRIFGAYVRHVEAQIDEMREAFGAGDQTEQGLRRLSSLHAVMEDADAQAVIDDAVLPQLYAMGEDPRNKVLLQAVTAAHNTPEMQALEAIIDPQYDAYVADILRLVLPEQITRNQMKDAASNLVILSQMVDTATPGAGSYNEAATNFRAKFFSALNREGRAPDAALFAHIEDAFENPAPQHAVAQAFVAQLLVDYTAFHGATQGMVGALTGVVQGRDFTQPDFVAYEALKARASQAQLAGIRGEVFTRSYTQLLPRDHFVGLYNDADYAVEAQESARRSLEELSEMWQKFIFEASAATHGTVTGGAAVTQAILEGLTRFEHYAPGSFDQYIPGLRHATFITNYRAGVVAGAGTYAALAAGIAGPLQVPGQALAAQLDNEYDAAHAQITGQIARINGWVAGHDAQLQDPAVFGEIVELKTWMQDAAHTALATAYVDDLHGQGVAVNFNQMATDYLAAIGDEPHESVVRSTRKIARALTARQTLLQQAVGRMRALTDEVQRNPFDEREFAELLELRPVVPGADTAALVQIVSNKLYEAGILDGAGYFNKFLPRFNTADGQALVAHLNAEHDRLRAGNPMRVVRDAVVAANFDLAPGAYDPTIAQVVAFMLDPVTTDAQKGVIGVQLFAKIMKSGLVRPNNVDQLDAMFNQYNVAPNQAEAHALRDEMKRRYAAFYGKKLQDVRDFVTGIFTPDYRPEAFLERYATDIEPIAFAGVRTHVNTNNWFRIIYTGFRKDGADARNDGTNYFQGLVAGVPLHLQAQVMPVAVALDAGFDAYAQALGLQVPALNVNLGNAVVAPQKFDPAHFDEMFNVWDHLREAQKVALQNTLFARLRADRVMPRAFYPDAVLDPQYAADARKQGEARAYRDTLQDLYKAYLVGELRRDLAAPVGAAQKFTNAQFDAMFKIWDDLDAVEQRTLADTLFERLKADGVPDNQFYTNAVLHAQYVAGGQRDAAKAYRNILVPLYRQYLLDHA